MQRVSIADIKNGARVVSRFILRGKRLSQYKGKPGHFLTLLLADSTGQLEAKIWEKAEDAHALIKAGDLLEIKGVATEYNGSIQINISYYRVCDEKEYNPRDFLPTCPRDAGEMLAELRAIIDTVRSRPLKDLLLSFFNDEKWVSDFCLTPAAKANHHAYLGGLLEHTLNLARAADAAAGLYPRLDRNLLLAGAILHDIGKIQEYSCDRYIDFTDEGRLIGHIVTGVGEVDRRISSLGGEETFPGDLRLKILHIITSHHGLYEWQSPKKPKIMEAAVIHILDTLDTVVDVFTKVIDENSDENTSWSPWNRTLERYIFLK
ncbi:MAG: 3'-5' exoribonuclease YhaM family protein [Bacillota bacterium]